MAQETNEKKKQEGSAGAYRRRNASAQKSRKEQDQEKDTTGSVTGGVWNFLTSILGFPFRLLLKYLRRELTSTIKHDMKIYFLLAGIAGMMFIFVVILWLTVALAVGSYFYEKGYSFFVSVLFSLAFQGIVILLWMLVARIAAGKRKTAQMIREFREMIKEEH
jgi:Flp pilus assembly protein TadB